MSKEESKVSGGGTRYTENKGSYTEDRTQNSSGRLVDITHHTSDGESHSHNVVRNVFGTPSAGNKK